MVVILVGQVISGFQWMFALFKSRPAEPVVIDASIVIDAPIEDVFDLLDLACPSNALRIQGYEFKDNLFGLARYCATHADAPGVVYHFDLDHYVANMEIGFRSWLECGRTNSAVTQSRSDYVLVGLTDASCRLVLTETATLRRGTGAKVAARERVAMTQLVNDHLLRLKLLAEYGADADVAA